ncbi:MAG: DapH/DapD/GlmU-related protein [Verrucomicrobia bacterium]|nr:DapH/DapD/GlmU-related protein [Verrucomicrobiota bacterium]
MASSHPVQYIAGDVCAKAQWLYGDTSGTSCLKALFTDGTFAMICYRLMQESQALGVVPLAMVFNKLNVIFGQCVIGRGAEFGQRFVLIHSQGIVINSAVRGGDDVRIEHQVTIGAEREASPRLGHRVFVGAGAKIIGNVQVGDDCRIGANAVVVDDIPSGVTAVGVPAKPVATGAP